MSIRLYNIFLIILFILLLCSCRKSTVDDTSNKSSDAKISSNVSLDSLRFKSGLFSTTNETRYENEVDGGVAAVLLFSKNKIDSIDLSSTIFAINDSTIFYKRFQNISNPEYPPSPGAVAGYADKYYLWSNGSRMPATTFLPLFSDIVSSPAFLDSCILYWGLKSKNSSHAVFAMRYHIVNHILDSVYLMDDEVATDYSGYFDCPIKDSVGYSFSKGSHSWHVDKMFNFKKPR